MNPLIGCGPLADWLRNKQSIYSLDQFNDNLCVWRCLAIYNRLKNGKKRAQKILV